MARGQHRPSRLRGPSWALSRLPSTCPPAAGLPGTPPRTESSASGGAPAGAPGSPARTPQPPARPPGSEPGGENRGAGGASQGAGRRPRPPSRPKHCPSGSGVDAPLGTCPARAWSFGWVRSPTRAARPLAPSFIRSLIHSFITRPSVRTEPRGTARRPPPAGAEAVGAPRNPLFPRRAPRQRDTRRGPRRRLPFPEARTLGRCGPARAAWSTDLRSAVLAPPRAGDGDAPEPRSGAQPRKWGLGRQRPGKGRAREARHPGPLGRAHRLPEPSVSVAPPLPVWRRPEGSGAFPVVRHPSRDAGKRAVHFRSSPRRDPVSVAHAVPSRWGRALQGGREERETTQFAALFVFSLF